jgi:hypothetical protein
MRCPKCNREVDRLDAMYRDRCVPCGAKLHSIGFVVCAGPILVGGSTLVGFLCGHPLGFALFGAALVCIFGWLGTHGIYPGHGLP